MRRASRVGRSRRSVWVLGALGACLIALLAASLVLAHRSSAEVDASAIAVAKQEAVNFYTLDAQHIDNEITAVLALASNPFKGKFATKSATLKAGVIAGHSSVSAVVPDDSAGLEYQGGSTSIVLVAVNETVTKPNLPSQTNHFRLRLHLTKVGGQWRVSQFQPVR